MKKFADELQNIQGREVDRIERQMKVSSPSELHDQYVYCVPCILSEMAIMFTH